MREVKFMAWLKDSAVEKMKDTGVCSLSRMMEVQIIDFDKKLVGFVRVNGSFWFSFDDIEIIEFTGLKDKNGKEIFEGDIVSVAYHTLNEKNEETIEHIISDVYYCEEGAQFCVNPPGGRIIEITDPENVEIIGTIYENPELLET